MIDKVKKILEIPINNFLVIFYILLAIFVLVFGLVGPFLLIWVLSKSVMLTLVLGFVIYIFFTFNLSFIVAGKSIEKFIYSMDIVYDKHFR